jgi:hypothetical protein
VNDKETEKSALCPKSGSKLPNGSKEEEKILCTVHNVYTLHEELVFICTE